MTEENANNGLDEKISYKIPFSERVGRNSLFNLAGNVISYILRFISIPIILSLIQFDMGYYFTITSYAGIVLLLYNFINLGINLSSSKFIAEYFSLGNKEKINSVYSVNLFLNVIASIITTFILIFIFFLFVPYQITISTEFFNIYILSVITLIIGRFFLNITTTYTYILSGFQRNDFYVFITTLVNLATSCFKIIFILIGLNVLGLIICDYLFLNIGGIAIYLLIKKRFRGLKFKKNLINWKNIKQYTSQGMSFTLANLDETFIIDLNTVMIPKLLAVKSPIADPNPSITIYGTCLKLSRYGMALTSSLEGGPVSIATELYTKGELEKFRELFGRLFNISFFLSIIIAAGISLLSPQILLHYVGPSFYNAWPILTSLIFMYSIKLSVGLCRFIIQSMNLTHKWMYIAFLEYGLIVTFSIIGFILADLSGLALGVLVAVMIYSIIFLFYTAYKIKYPFKNLIIKISKILFSVLIPSFILMIILYFNLIPFVYTQSFIYLLFDGLILLAYIGIGVLIFYFIKGFHKNDTDALKRSLRNIYKSFRRRIVSLFN
ncbi:MAG: oligosaccharide flippase family protein [Candidatus Helarchaeota archaeon]